MVSGIRPEYSLADCRTFWNDTGHLSLDVDIQNNKSFEINFSIEIKRFISSKVASILDFISIFELIVFKTHYQYSLKNEQNPCKTN